MHLRYLRWFSFFCLRFVWCQGKTSGRCVLLIRHHNQSAQGCRQLKFAIKGKKLTNDCHFRTAIFIWLLNSFEALVKGLRTKCLKTLNLLFAHAIKGGSHLVILQQPWKWLKTYLCIKGKEQKKSNKIVSAFFLLVFATIASFSFCATANAIIEQMKCLVDWKLIPVQTNQQQLYQWHILEWHICVTTRGTEHHFISKESNLVKVNMGFRSKTISCTSTGPQWDSDLYGSWLWQHSSMSHLCHVHMSWHEYPRNKNTCFKCLHVEFAFYFLETVLHHLKVDPTHLARPCTFQLKWVKHDTPSWRKG